MTSVPGPDHTAPSARRTLLLSLLIGAWLLLTLAGLWWFQQQNVRPFVSIHDDPAFWQAPATGQLLLPLLQAFPPPASTQVTLLHFWNPDCLCNQISQRHFDGLIRAFEPQALRIIVVAPATATDDQLARFRELNGRRMSVIRAPAELRIPASPGLALFGPDMRMGYYGAYGFGALCTVANDDFFPNIVRTLRHDSYGPFVNVAGNGCFCAWPTGANTSAQ